MEDYTLETLSGTFAKHAEMSDKQIRTQVSNFKEAFPDTPLPDWMANPFNVSRALSVMACEIEKLKNSVGIKENI